MPFTTKVYVLGYLCPSVYTRTPKVTPKYQKNLRIFRSKSKNSTDYHWLSPHLVTLRVPPPYCTIHGSLGETRGYNILKFQTHDLTAGKVIAFRRSKCMLILT